MSRRIELRHNKQNQNLTNGNTMQIAVIGAGAVGCYYGAKMLRAGHDVTFVGRRAHVDAINANGLLLESVAFTGHIAAQATTTIAGLSTPPDLVFFAVKSGDTDSTARELAAVLKPESIVLSLQNGVDNPERLRAILRQSVIAAAVYVAAEMPGAGHVKHNGRGELVIGSAPGSDAIAAALCAAEVPTTVSQDIATIQWTKLVNNCAYNALSAVAQIAYGEMFKVDGTREVMTAVVGECVSVARACGVALPHDLLDTILGLVKSMPDQLSSTAQDLARGKASEIDFLNGFIVRKGVEHGILTPTNRALLLMVKLAERSQTKAKLG
jgi:2-dehydropantoate 2-reductase